MTIIDQPRQKAGTPIGGRFANRTFTESSITLSERGLSSDGPTLEQLERATTEARRQIACGQATGDPSVLAESIAAKLASQEAAYLAYLRGETHPDDALFDAIWDGSNKQGYSEDMVVSELAHAKRVRSQLAAGIIKPDEVLGYYELHPTERAAKLWLDECVALYSEALQCGGKNLSVNQSNVMRRKVRTTQSA